jgi:hypothetical protein
MSRDLKTLLLGALFALPLVALGLGLERGMRHVVTSYTAKSAALERHAGTARVLVLGSSNALDGVATPHLGAPAVNLANVTQTLYYDLALAELYVPRLPRLALVILPLSHIMFEGEIYDSAEHWRAYFYERTWGIPPQRPRFWEADRWSLTSLLGVRFSLKCATKRFHVDTVPEIDDTGWDRKPAPDGPARSVSDAAGAERAAYLDSFISPSHVADNVARLDRLASLLEGRGVPLALVALPAQAAFVRHLSPAVLAANAAALEGLRRRHPLLFVDHVADARFGAEDFLDGDHLSERGAVKLAGILADELVRPALARTPPAARP